MPFYLLDYFIQFSAVYTYTLIFSFFLSINLSISYKVSKEKPVVNTAQTQFWSIL